MLSVHNRLKLVRKELGYTQEQLGEICGIKKSAYSMIETGTVKLTNRNLELLISKLHINKEWLINGTGEMFTENNIQLKCANSKSRPKYSLVPVYDINILNSSGINSPENILKFIPFCNANYEDIAVVVNDPSMSPMITMNSIVLLHRCMNFDFRLNNGKTHLIMFKDGRRYIRNLYQDGKSKEIIICRATNKDFDDTEIEVSKLTAIYKVTAIYYDNSY